MSYSDVYDVLAMYANDLLNYYADGWSRFPSHPVAQIIIDRLNASIDTWVKLDKDVAGEMTAARDEIIKRAN